LRQRGIEPPQPAPGFRFGMLEELEIPLGIDVEPLEAAVDQAAAHLFYGEDASARAALAEVVGRYPCVRGLLESPPLADHTEVRRDGPSMPHLRALR
jgi:hypothetical protein